MRRSQDTGIMGPVFIHDFQDLSCLIFKMGRLMAALYQWGEEKIRKRDKIL